MKFYSCTIALVLAAGLMGAAQSQTADDNKLPLEELRTLSTAFGILKAHSVSQPSNSRVVQAAILGMVKEIDPDGGAFYTAEDYAVMSDLPKFASVGLEITVRNGDVVVVAPIPDSPGEQAGIRPKDVLRSIDGTPVEKQMDAVKLLRGQPGSKVRIELTRAGQPLALTVERALVRQKTASLRTVAPGLAVLTVRSFQVDTLSSVASLLAEQWQRAPLQGLVLDLRRNPGGLFAPAVGLASLFLPPHSVVTELKGRDQDNNQVYRAEPEFYARGSDPWADIPAAIRNVPLVVLVDEGTASGAEIVAAALKHYQRAKIIGRQTFGRSSIQTIFPMQGNTAIKLTTAYWLTPSHSSIDKLGVAPDIFIQTQDPEIEQSKAIEVLRKARH